MLLLLNAEDPVERPIVLPLDGLNDALLQIRLLAAVVRLHVLQASLDLGPRDFVAIIVQSAGDGKYFLNVG